MELFFFSMLLSQHYNTGVHRANVGLVGKWIVLTFVLMSSHFCSSLADVLCPFFFFFSYEVLVSIASIGSKLFWQ